MRFSPLGSARAERTEPELEDLLGAARAWDQARGLTGARGAHRFPARPRRSGRTGDAAPLRILLDGYRAVTR